MFDEDLRAICQKLKPLVGARADALWIAQVLGVDYQELVKPLLPTTDLVRENRNLYALGLDSLSTLLKRVDGLLIKLVRDHRSAPYHEVLQGYHWLIEGQLRNYGFDLAEFLRVIHDPSFIARIVGDLPRTPLIVEIEGHLKGVNFKHDGRTLLHLDSPELLWDFAERVQRRAFYLAHPQQFVVPVQRRWIEQAGAAGHGVPAGGTAAELPLQPFAGRHPMRDTPKQSRLRPPQPEQFRRPIGCAQHAAGPGMDPPLGQSSPQPRGVVPAA
jgi:hypothetical protein